MIAIKKLENDKILLISLDGTRRYLVDHQKLKKSGLGLGLTCSVELVNYVPEKFNNFVPPSNLYFEVSKNEGVVEGKGTYGILKKERGSGFFVSKIFGRVACTDCNINISKLDISHPIVVTLISEKDKVGDNSVCHWGAVIDENPKIKEKNNEKNGKEESKKVQKQCVGVVTKVEINEKNVKTYYCWLTDQHVSSVIFDGPKKKLDLQRGDFFRANFVKFKTSPKWKFVSYIERIEPLTPVHYHKDTISLSVRLHNIKRANEAEFRANTEAYHPLVGNIIDVWDVLDDDDSDGTEVKILIHRYDGEWCWAISTIVDDYPY